MSTRKSRELASRDYDALVAEHRKIIREISLLFSETAQKLGDGEGSFSDTSSILRHARERYRSLTIVKDAYSLAARLMESGAVHTIDELEGALSADAYSEADSLLMSTKEGVAKNLIHWLRDSQ